MRPAVALLACAALAVGVSACGSATTTPDVAATVSGSVRPTPTPAPTGTATPGATTGATTSTGPAPTAAPPRAPSPTATTPPCVPDLVTVTATRTSDPTADVRLTLTVRNRSSAACELRGWPGVSLVSLGGVQIGRAADRAGAAGALPPLKPGASATAQVVIAATSEATCEIVMAQGLRVYLPGQYDVAFVPLEYVGGCRQPDAPAAFTITAFAPA